MRRTPKALLLSLALLATPSLADEGKGADEPEFSNSGFRRQGALLDRSPQRRQSLLSVFAGFPYGLFYYGGFPVGLGARYMLPLVHEGFIPSVNDSFGLEAGVDFTGVTGRTFYPALGIPVEAYWMFHFTPQFGAYAKVGVAVELGFVQYCDVNGFCYGAVGVRPISGVGITYKITDALVARVELGYPWFKLGLGFGF